MKYRDYAIKRLLLTIPTLFGLSIFTFLFYLNEIDPAYAYAGGGQIKGGPAFFNAVAKKLGLGQPVYIQYLDYLNRLFIKFDWGYSTSFGFYPVLTLLAGRFASTVELTVFALVVGLIIGIPIGIFSAVKKNQSSKDKSRLFALLNISLPIFWIGIMLQVLLAGMNSFFPFLPTFPIYGSYNSKVFSVPHRILFGLLPATGFLTIDSLASFQFNFFIDVVMHLFTPMFVLSLMLIPFISKMTKVTMIELRQKDLLLAKNQTLKERILIYKQVFKNASLPILTLIGIILSILLTGDILIEFVFIWPGIGLVAAMSLWNLDINSLEGYVLFTAILFVLSKLVIDLIYGYIDPQVINNKN